MFKNQELLNKTTHPVHITYTTTMHGMHPVIFTVLLFKIKPSSQQHGAVLDLLLTKVAAARWKQE
jgi:hypothetical protein